MNRERPRARGHAGRLRTLAALIAVLHGALAGTHALAADARETCLSGHAEAAVRACQSAIASGAHELVVYLALGAHLNGLGRFEEAAENYRRALQRYPQDRRLASNLQIAESNLREQSWATRQRASAATGRSDARSQATDKINRIRCLKATGATALQACDLAIARAPGDAALHVGRGRALRALARDGQALSAYREALRLEPSNGEAHAAVALLDEPARAPVAPTPAAVQQTPVAVERPPTRQVTRPADPPRRTQTEPKPARAGPSRALVAEIQTLLNELGMDAGSADGIPGPATRRAARTFQRFNGDPTAAALDEPFLVQLRDARKRHRIAGAALQAAQAQRSRGELEQALASVKRSLALAPWHAPLQALQASLTHEIDARRTRIARDSERVEQAADLAAQAAAQYRAGNLREALDLVARSLRLAPGQAAALALRDEVQSQQQASQRASADSEQQRLQQQRQLAEALRRLDAQRAALTRAHQEYDARYAELALGAQRTLQRYWSSR